jgi:hypothetical protein
MIISAYFWQKINYPCLFLWNYATMPLTGPPHLGPPHAPRLLLITPRASCLLLLSTETLAASTSYLNLWWHGRQGRGGHPLSSSGELRWHGCNDMEDILSQALEYRRTLRRELDFDSTWEQEREAIHDQSGDALAGRAGGQGAPTQPYP